jgi:hypothetical protein
VCVCVCVCVREREREMRHVLANFFTSHVSCDIAFNPARPGILATCGL